MISSRDRAHKKPLERRAYYPTDEDIAATIAEYGGVSRDGVLLEPSGRPDGPGAGRAAVCPRAARVGDARGAAAAARRADVSGRLPHPPQQPAAVGGAAEGRAKGADAAGGRRPGHRRSPHVGPGPRVQWVAKGWVDDSGTRGRAEVYVLTAAAHTPHPEASATDEENPARPASL